MRHFLHKIYRFVIPQNSPLEIKRKYGIPDNLNWIVQLSEDGWFIAECKDLPSLYTQARSKQELLDMVNDVVLSYYDVPKRVSDYIYDELRLSNNETIRYEVKTVTA